MKSKTTYNKIINRALAWLMAVAMTISTVLTGWTPVMADTTSGITLTVIGDTGDHSSDASGHTGYVYWMKDVPLDVDLDSLEDNYIAKNCGTQIQDTLKANGITTEIGDESSLYMNGMSKGGVNLESAWPAGWSVMVVYADGSFSSNGWGEYNGAASLQAGCRLIYYWSDDSSNDCRLTTDDNWNTTLNYDTDAITGVGLYETADADTPTGTLNIEAGLDQTFITKFTVPTNSTVSRELTLDSTNKNVADAELVQGGIKIKAISAGEADITASMTNTLGDVISTSCHVNVTSAGTTVTGMSFEEGNTLSMNPGDTGSLTPVFTPSLTAEDPTPGITWTSSNTEVASVDPSTGEIEALTPGETVITGSFTNNVGTIVSATCTLTVQGVDLTGLSFDKNSLDLDAGDNGTLNLRYTPANATEIPDIIWTSSDSTVATVSGNKTSATVTAVNGGSTTITAAAGNITATCEVTVAGTATFTNMLGSLTFANNASAATIYRIVSELDQTTKEITVAIPESTNAFAILPTLSDGVAADSIKAVYTNYNNAAKNKVLTNGTYTAISGTDRLFNANQDSKDIQIVVTSGTHEETYTVHVVRESLMSGLSLTDQDGNVQSYEPTFSRDVKEYTLKVPNTVTSLDVSMTAYNAGSTDFTINEKAAENGKGSVDLKDNVTTIIMTAGNDKTVPAEYKLTVTKVVPAAISVVTDPADAVVAVYDKNGLRVWDTDGNYNLLPDQDYTYTVTKNGYIGQSGTWNLSEGGTKNITLKKAADSTLKDLDTDWSGFRPDANNQGITSAVSPINPESAGLKWEKQYGEGYSTSAVSSMILVDDKIYAYSGQRLLKIDKATGDLLDSTTMIGTSSFAINPPTYANGMIFVGLTGKVQAFNAETLESLWVYTDPLGGQPNSTLRYDGGYLYTGFWSGNKGGNMVCISTADENPDETTEAKEATWRAYDAGGFYWAGSYTNEKYVIVGSDESYLYCLDKLTGKEVQKIELNNGEIRSDISYANGRIYFTTKTGGFLYSFNLKEDGTIDTENLIEPLNVGAMSTSTPVVYNNRAYVGVTHGGNFSGKYGIAVVDLDSSTGAMSLAYELATDGYPQTSGTLTTAYEGSDGYVYVYFCSNSAAGNLYVLKDKAGMTEPDPASGILFTPVHKQYCICSPVVDKDGTIYFKNDSAYMMAVTTNAVYLTGASVSGGNAALDDNAAFNGQLLSHNIVVDPGTETFNLKVDATEGSTVTMNGVEGAQQDISLTDGKATVTVALSKDGSTGSYTFNVRERTTDADLSNLVANASNSYTSSILPLTPEFKTDTTDYAASYMTGKTFLNVWPKAADENASIKVTAVSGVKNCAEGDEIKVTSSTGGNTRYAIYFADTTYATPAKVKITVTAEDGVTTKDYTMTLSIDSVNPVLTIGDSAITERKADTATLTLDASEPSKAYYYVAKDEEAAPTASELTTKGTAVEVQEGSNTVALTELTKDAGTVYVVLQDSAGRTSDVQSVKLEELVEATGITVTPTNIAMLVGTENTLNAVIAPKNVTDKSVTWSSDKEDIASVDSNGIVKAVAKGTATITAATANGKTATCTVTVADPKEITVTLSAQAAGGFLLPRTEVQIKSGLAAEYGYKDVIAPATQIDVTTLDALVALHKALFGDDFTPESAKDYLDVASSGWITKIFGEDNAMIGFTVNGFSPNNGNYGEDGDGAIGYMINQSVLSDKDNVEFLMYQDLTMYMDYYTWFENSKGKTEGFTVKMGTDFTLALKGYILAYAGYYEPNSPAQGVQPMEDIQITTMDATGNMTDIPDAVTDADGQVTLNFAETGTYILGAKSDEDLPNFTPWCVVKVVETTDEELAAKAVDEKIAAIGKVTINKKAAIDQAQAAYDKLSETEKALVKNTSVLTAAQMTYTALNKSLKWKHNSKGWWYEASDGSYLKNTWKTISKKQYYFDGSGYMATGWKIINGKWYYFGKAGDGAMKTGWQKVSGKWYYMNNSGAMLTGKQTIQGKSYYLNGSGAMLTGWQKISGKWYYMNTSGEILTGWQKVSGKWYYMNKTGVMLTGWQTINGKSYYLNGSGAMLTGWQKINNKWYYLNSGGAMQTGWIKLGSQWYYLYKDGHMAANTWIGNSYVNGSGVWTKSK